MGPQQTQDLFSTIKWTVVAILVTAYFGGLPFHFMQPGNCPNEIACLPWFSLERLIVDFLILFPLVFCIRRLIKKAGIFGGYKLD